MGADVAIVCVILAVIIVAFVFAIVKDIKSRNYDPWKK